MKRLDLIEQLETVQNNIETVQRQLVEDMPMYYETFGKAKQWEHLLEIRVSALAYWRRKFNRILLKLGYKL
jgi:hypothetical protein